MGNTYVLDKNRQRNSHPIAIALFLLVMVFGIFWAVYLKFFTLIGITLITALMAISSIQIGAQWEKAVILRFGKFHRLAGPGIFFVIPVVETITTWIDQRVQVIPFNAEETLTKDTVPVNVDAVMFWVVWDAEKAALEVKDYEEAVSWAAQTTLRDVIGRTMMSDLLSNREHIDHELRQIIDQKTEPWGISVQSVEIRDVVIPPALQEAMSREAQAERESKARMILGNAENLVAGSFVEAAKSYQNNPVAMQLRAMNILYEGLKEKGALVVVPSSAVETMGLGTITGLTSAAKNTDWGKDFTDV
ncbi:MAG: peptidase [Firmicutes bacterium HGW-Firmicutes-14]|jgi:regulator of protease activity HflC (stomatin/prohibitin superfamily)|nr:MAG: peptidase [Firmicutes bacterium HGW-Firmicutes-14]